MLHWGVTELVIAVLAMILTVPAIMGRSVEIGYIFVLLGLGLLALGTFVGHAGLVLY